MIKTLIVFLALSFLCCLATNEAPDTKSLRLLRSTGPPLIPGVDLTTTGYQVFVDLATNIKTGHAMLIALYTSETVFFNNKLNGAKFECGTLGSECSKIIPSVSVTVNTPYLKVNGERIRQSVFLDHHHWCFHFTTYQPILLNSYEGYYDGRGTFGFIGMGRKPNNRFFTEMFSIYLENDHQGILLFGNDLNFAQFNTSQTSLPATEDWHVINLAMIEVKSKTTVKKVPLERNIRILFDINQDDISLNGDFMNSLLSALKGFLTSCQTANVLMTCAFNDDFNSLPTIDLVLAGGEKLKIPPEVYAASASKGQVTFKIFHHPSFIKSGAFGDSIILGSKFMQHYYTVFDGLNRKIHFYTAKNRRDVYETRVDPTPSDKKEDSGNSGSSDDKGSNSKENGSSNMIIIGGIILIVIMLAINAYLTKKKSQNELSRPIMPYPQMGQNPFTNYHPQQMPQNIYYNQPETNSNHNSQQNSKENIVNSQGRPIYPSIPSSNQAPT